jgi:adenylate cyclase
MASRALIRLGISALLFALFMVHVSGAVRFRLLDAVENFSYDARIRMTLPGTPDPRVVIVDMDERSLVTEGWPWRRDKLGRLIEQLFETYGIRALGFDMVFSEPDDRALSAFDELAQSQLAGLPGLAERAGAVRESLDYDQRFAEALKGRPVVMGFTFKPQVPEGEAAATGGICAPLMDRNSVKLYAVDFIKAVGHTGNLKKLQEGSAYCGFFDNPRTDDDGVFRRVPLVQSYEGEVYSSLALSLARLALGSPPFEMEFEPPDQRTSLNLERVRLGTMTAPVDGDVAVYVPYRGPPYTFRYVSATDVLNGKVDPPEILKDTVVLFGATAAGLLDFRTTPVAGVHQGVEVHANIVSGLLDGSIRQKAPYYNGIETIELLIVAVLLAWGFSRFGAGGAALTVAVLIALISALAFWLWDGAMFIMPLGMPVLFTLVLFMAHLLYGYFIESRGKREISKLFGQYVPPELVEEMAAHPEAISMEGESREMTVLFSDVRNFTSISEKLDAKELAAMINAFLTQQTAVVQKYRGTIDKYIGDLIMAFWGAPLADKDHALHGVLTGMEMQRAIRALDPEFEKRGWPKLHIGVGINSGKMNVGNMGSEFRMAYTVMGDSVNLGSRLEGLTKEYGVGVMISEYTRNLLPGDWAFRELDLIRVKGKKEPVTIYEPMGPKEELDPSVRNDLARHRGALKQYRAQQWDEAESAFFELKTGAHPHPVYDLMIQRIMEFRENPPGKDWDGAFNFAHK